MEDKRIRLLHPSEIEVRVQTVSEKGVSLLLYKDARVDQKILDETFGPFGWKRSHQSIDGNLYCTVEVRDVSTGEWVAKQDVGTKGHTEQEKSQASDSFKRACFNWGIGRELYSAPFIWIPAARLDIQRRGDRLQCCERFHVEAIYYSDAHEICGLSICKGNGQRVYSWGTPDSARDAQAVEQAGQEARQGTAPGNNGTRDAGSLSVAQLESLHKELVRTGVTMEAVNDRYHITGKPEEMPQELYAKVMRALGKTKPKAA